jgi:RNase P subunit RPR2
MPIYGKPDLETYVLKHCAHCGTEYRVNYHMTLMNREIIKKGKEGWL